MDFIWSIWQLFRSHWQANEAFVAFPVMTEALGAIPHRTQLFHRGNFL